MKKLICSLLAGVMALGMLSGCGGSEEATKDGKAKIMIVSSERSSQKVMQELIDGFNASHPDIEVQYECKDDTVGDYLKTTYTSKNPPDIHISFSGMDSLRLAGMIRPLPDDFMEWARENVIKDAIGDPDLDGKYYSIGKSGGAAAKLAYNKDLFAECGIEAPPKTFAEMREIAKIITEKGNGVKYGFALPLKDAVFTRYYVMIPGCPSGLMNRDGFDPATDKFDYSIYGKMVGFLRELIADGSVFPTPYTLDNDTARAQFAEGNVGMIYAHGWDVAVYNDQFPAKCDWAVVDYPVFDELKGGHPFGVGGTTGWYMSALSKYPDAQYEVFKWLYSEEVQKRLLETNSISSATLKSLADVITNSEKKNGAEFATRTYPLFKTDWPKRPSPTIEGDDDYTTLKNLILDPTLDIDAELSALNDRYNKGYEQFKLDKTELGEDVSKYHMPDVDYIVDSPEDE